MTISSSAPVRRDEGVEAAAAPSPARRRRRRTAPGRASRLAIGSSVALVALDRRRQLAGPAGAQVDEGLLQRGEQKPRLGVGVGGEDVEAEHHVGLGELLRGLEARAVDVDRVLHLGRREVRGEGVGQAEHGGELRADRCSSRGSRPARPGPRRARRARAGRARPAGNSPSARRRPAGNCRRRHRGCGAARARSPCRCPARGRGRGRCGPDAARPACRTARR